MTPVVFQITQFPNDAVAAGKLYDQIIAAGLPIAYVDCATFTQSGQPAGTSTSMFFRELTAPEMTTLDGVVAAHDGVPIDVTLEVGGTISGNPVTAIGVPYVSAV